MDVEEYDVFISHASEDKSSIAWDLTQRLVSYKLKVWCDESTLEGDSLTEKINYGLNNSLFGIVILSKNFFTKNWTREELNALTAKSIITGRKSFFQYGM